MPPIKASGFTLPKESVPRPSSRRDKNAAAAAAAAAVPHPPIQPPKREKFHARNQSGSFCSKPCPCFPANVLANKQPNPPSPPPPPSGRAGRPALFHLPSLIKFCSTLLSSKKGRGGDQEKKGRSEEKKDLAAHTYTPARVHIFWVGNGLAAGWARLDLYRVAAATADRGKRGN